MINSINFYYEISKDAKLATDGMGGYSECYMKLAFNLNNPVNDSEYEEIRTQMEPSAIKGASNVLNIDEAHLKLISEDEYLLNSEDDEDYFNDEYEED